MVQIDKRARVRELVDVVDEEFLDGLYLLMEAYIKEELPEGIAGYDVRGNPVTLDELHASTQKGIAEAKLNGGLTPEQQRKELREWRSSSM